MPKLLIVDDEAIFRKGLHSIIVSARSDWEVVGAAKDGYEALEMIEQLKPDVLLTDIRMPRMDGIQLQKIARERFPELLSVVISGYEDFTYVRQSMRHGSIDYLMKPIEREELLRVLDKLEEDLKAGFLKTREHEDAPDEPRVRRQAEDLLVAGMNRRSVGQQHLDALARLGVNLEEPYFASFAIKLDKQSVDGERYRNSDPSLFQLYIRQFVQEMIDNRGKGFCFVYSDSEVAALINLPDPDRSRGKLSELAESIGRQIKSLSNLTVTIGVGRCVKSFENVPESFNEARIALLYRLVVGGDKVLEYEKLVTNVQVASGLKKWTWEALEQAINAGKTDEIDGLVETVVSDLCDKATTPETVHQQICKLLLHYYELSEDLGITKDWLGTDDIRALILEACAVSSQDELIDYCRKVFGDLTASIASGRQSLERDPIQKAIRYVERHYAEQISLKDIADHVFLNTAYFSTLFKQKTGTAFVEYLSGIRLEEAKRRLTMTDEKITNIAELTGFANIRHFNRVFKNDAGMTPKDYRDGHSRK
ncbi:response regulator [Cohnella sp. GCM10027633]|uniref:response regulator n=1 Tax=unclassified Cohnella TaxID=2636738 RepID=UPI0036446F06